MTLSIERGRAAAIGLAFAAMLAAPAAAQRQNLEACPTTFQGTPNQAVACFCPREAVQSGGTVWGTGVYSDDSAICRAARHAGAVGNAGGGVIVVPMPGQSSYRGTRRNGVTSESWNTHSRSFTVARLDPRRPVDQQVADAGAKAPPMPAAPPSAPPPQAALPATPGAACPSNFLEGPAQGLTCTCSAAAVAGSAPVWGTDIYTADSSICRAARHAGAVGSEGGVVRVSPAPGQQSYPPSERNGVASAQWAAYDRSFRVEGEQAAGGKPPAPQSPQAAAECPAAAPDQPVTCTCTAAAVAAEAPVWGTDVYTADSSICRAARHAGVVGPEGGTVRVSPAPGRQSYAASERNGVATSEWGAYDRSFSVEAPPAADAAPSPPAAPAAPSAPAAPTK